MNLLNLLKISAHDNMYENNMEQGLERYILCGVAGISAICKELDIINLWPKRILDMPSGYGRVLRFIKAGFPNADIYACDIREDAVDFCRDTFNVKGIYSKDNIAEIEFPTKFDLIWAGSLITHMRLQRTLEFIKVCLKRLSSGGILIMTSHGRSHYDNLGIKDKIGLDNEQIKTMKVDYDNLGYGYGSYLKFSDKKYDYLNDWGVSIIKKDWFYKASSDIGFKIIAYRECGWAGQDVITIKPL